MMTITEAARELGYSREMVYRLAERGEIRVIRDPNKLKGRTMVPREDVERLKERKAQIDAARAAR